jgi:hypothetical protein
MNDSVVPDFGVVRGENGTTTEARNLPLQEFLTPGVNECIIIRGRIGLEDVRRFLEGQLRLFYERHGHGNHVSIETRPWLGENIIDDEYRRNLPASGLLRQQYDRARDLQSARTFLQHRAGEFAITLLARGRQDYNYREREEIATRIFDFTLLQDALSGFSGPLEHAKKEYWILSRKWASDHDIKWDYATGTNISMMEFFKAWLHYRDLIIYEAEQRLATRTASSIAQLLNDLNR